MEKVAIYGFGSYFNKKTNFKDVDLLLLHLSTSQKSCQFSLRCKKHLLANLSDADITILSASEERQLDFLDKSKARYLGKVYEKSAENDLNLILAKISRVNAFDKAI